jgi:MFS family permease
MYSVFGIPTARLADRFGRARVLGGVVAICSVLTILTGRTASFTTMLLARGGVAIGEAGGGPSAHALVTDYFSPHLRGKALSFIGVCSALGLSLALVGGGLINDRYGWRMAFYLGGLPGLILSGLVLFTVREPQVVHTGEMGRDKSPRSVTSTVATLWKRRAFPHLCAGLGVASIGSYGQLAWTPAFLMRTYHMTSGQVGSHLSAMVAPASIVAILLGGVVNDWLDAYDKRWPLWILALTFAIGTPLSLIYFLAHNFNLAMAMALTTTLASGLWVAPAFALVQSLAGPNLRASAAAIFMMIVNIIGLGLGPYITGVLSDALAQQFGVNNLAVSLCIVSMTFPVGCVTFLLGARTVVADIAEANP